MSTHQSTTAKKSRSNKLERQYQEKVLDYLNNVVGGHWIKICASAYQKEGEPDIVGCYKGKFYAIELKKDKDARASALQLYKLKKIKDNGGISMKAYNMEQIKELFGDGGNRL